MIFKKVSVLYIYASSQTFKNPFPYLNNMPLQTFIIVYLNALFELFKELWLFFLLNAIGKLFYFVF